MKTKIVLLVLLMGGSCFAAVAQDTSGKRRDIGLYGDFSKNLSTRRVNSIKSDPLSAIVVIDNKIYQNNSLELSNFRLSNFELVHQITDSSSHSIVKSIFIYRSKKAY